ncbi:uncharacterized protein LOC100183125 [Ciona intestinalis]
MFLKLILFVFLSFSEPSTAFFFGRLRICNHQLLNRVEIVNISHSYESHVVNNSIKLTMNVSWEAVVPEGLELDGFLVSVHKLVYTNLYFEDSDVLKPINYCLNRTDQFWVKPAANESCPEVPTSCMTSSGSYCPCTSGSSLLYNGGNATCRGISHILERDPGKYVSVTAETRSLQYEATFHQNYGFTIIPYYRHYASRDRSVDVSHMLTAANDCIGTLRNSSDFTESEATQACCDSNIENILPRNLSVRTLLPDFSRDYVNVSVTWLPPVSQSGLVGFHVFVFKQWSRLNVIKRAFASRAKPVPLDGAIELAACDVTTTAYETTLYNLVPGQSYTVKVISNYSVEENDRYGCWGWTGPCSNELIFTLSDVNPCDNKWELCHSNATCHAMDPTGVVTLNATCSCNTGYEGEGLNSNDSNGCMDIDHCKTELSNKCDESSLCVDEQAPLVGVKCSCPPGHFGDGLKDGSGCVNAQHLTLKIALPLAALVLILIVVVLVITKRRSLCKRDSKFSHLESSQNSIKSETPSNEEKK